MTKRILVFAAMLIASLLLVALAAWGTGALWFQLPAADIVRKLALAAWLVLGVAALVCLWRRSYAAPAVWLVLLLALMAWWSTIKPSHDRVWADDVARMVTGKVDGGVVTLDLVRNFDWRSDTDYTVRWEPRQYDLNQLRSVDVAMSYWMGPAIAHTLVSFGFSDGRYLTFSIEIRKERGESFDGLAGFFKKYETVLIAADERDILRVRTNVRDEDMWLYRLKMPPEMMRSLFLAYLDEGEQLKATPRFYNTLTGNCTTIIYQMARRITPGLPLNWRLLASGYLDRYLYDLGALQGQGGFDALRQNAHITARARAADKDIDFSERIRH
ncbi:DUF4105 domain-containing protein [Pseudoduganella sp. FT26W]|uniref:DUF4105 domain-containing protein n=1 Tax=Duganella aquatilis TaxID=2666082 RepID=A0A844DC34_9BURK|nr:DUF4105 domain-containing protein [Duganella aquatilis]MRW85966.1 DUF4105 domain-containing protein [Duganella aquatilis]